MRFAHLLIVLSLALASPAAAARRYAVVVGANRGDAADEPLRFAESDAKRMGELLVEVGGVQREDLRLQLGGSASDVDALLKNLDAQLRASALPGDQLLLYFSGHADEGELHLEGTRLPLAALNAFVQRAPVEVALLIIDSCRSGAITRLKGLRPVGPTEVSVDAPGVKGRVIIGSSGADEYAQESDTLQGSYFTHHLLAGLRGAADLSHDGVVTLDEAYAYAYAHTVESTFGTRGGVQHPSYHVDLRGEGELALSAPGRARGRLRVEVAAAGELLVVRPAGEVVAEFVKGEGPAELALPPGPYEIRMRSGGLLAQEHIDVPDGGQAVLRADALHPAPLLAALYKGGGGPQILVGLGASVGTPLTTSVNTGLGLALELELDRLAPALGPFGDLVASLQARSATAVGAVPYLEQTVDLRAGPAFGVRFQRIRIRLAPEVGATFARQTRLTSGEARLALVPQLGVAPAIDLRLSGPLWLYLSGFGGAARVDTIHGTFIRARGDVSLGAALSL